MPVRSKYRKRRRNSKEKLEIISEDSDNEVSFKVKRPRRGSIGSEGSSNSNSSADSGFKSNSSTSSSVVISSEHHEVSSNSASLNKDTAIYYAKKSPAKQPQSSHIPTLLPHESSKQLVFPDNIEVNKYPEKETKLHSSYEVRSSTDPILLGHKRNKNVKGLTLDVEASAKRRKVENNIEWNTANKVLPRRSPNGYLLPEPVPVGIILTDLKKTRWKIGKSIGIGGFGEIYSAEHLADDNSTKCTTNYVIKVEPHSNGPLFVETNFYLRATRKDSIEEWKQDQGLLHLGVPHVEGSGSFRLRGKKFRFLVIPRYGTDLQTLLDQSGSTLSVTTACSIAKQLVDSYEYIHSQGYVHKDCKGSNILFINRGSAAPEVTQHTPMKKICLVDYGLVSKYVQEGGLHKPYRIDERSAHEGTLEYASRDAHLGCVSRRGDFEVLLYCLIEWLGGKLPWDQPEQPHPKEIHKSKIKAFRDIELFLNNAFSECSEDTKVPPTVLIQLMKYIDTVAFEEKPDYHYVRSIFQTEEDLRQSDPYSGNYSSEDEEVNLALSIRSKYNFTPPPPISPIADDTDDEIVFKHHDSEKQATKSPRTRHMDEANIKQRIEEAILAKKAATKESEVTRLSEERFLKERETLYKEMCIKSLQNPTPVMLQQMDKIEGRRQKFQRSMSEIKDSPFRRSKFLMVGAKRARSRSLVIYDKENRDLSVRTPKHDTKDPATPRSLQYRKTMQRRKGGAVKRLFSPTRGSAATIASATKILRRSRKSGKSIGLSPSTSELKALSRRRHRSGPAKELASHTLLDENSSAEALEIPALKSTTPYRRNKKSIPLLPTQEKQYGFSKHVQDFSSMFNKALSNVTKSILRYNSKP